LARHWEKNCFHSRPHHHLPKIEDKDEDEKEDEGDFGNIPTV
jgi:hypothetical protein